MVTHVQQELGLHRAHALKKRFQACALDRLLLNEPYKHAHFLSLRLQRWKFLTPVGVMCRFVQKDVL